MPAQTATTATLRLDSASPSFTVNDLGKSRDFYCNVLGFEEKQRWEHDGKLMGLELAAGDVSFMIGQDDWKKGRNRTKGEGFRIYCATTQDVDVLAKEIQARGGKLEREVKDEEWGRHFSVSDPDGFKITISNEKKKT
ncbi:MAG TPA: VOC family protein [Thermoanaerobaculia bacterium]|nr:VOC family protein [Thermoanaerobaculia bacterium]